MLVVPLLVELRAYSFSLSCLVSELNSMDTTPVVRMRIAIERTRIRILYCLRAAVVAGDTYLV
jgi:hypothetical protein